MENVIYFSLAPIAHLCDEHTQKPGTYRLSHLTTGFSLKCYQCLFTIVSSAKLPVKQCIGHADCCHKQRSTNSFGFMLTFPSIKIKYSTLISFSATHWALFTWSILSKEKKSWHHLNLYLLIRIAGPQTHGMQAGHSQRCQLQLKTLGSSKQSKKSSGS